MSKIAIVAPPSESTSPNVAMPVISYSLAAPSVSTLTVWPTARSPLSARAGVDDDLPVALRPVAALELQRAELRVLACRSASPNVGAPPAPPITLPSWPMISDLLASSAAIVPPAALDLGQRA